MKRVCAWCNEQMGDIPSQLFNEQVITHGICDTCLNTFFKNKHIDFIPFLNSISAPVVMIDDNNNYISANDSALSYLGKEHQNLNQKRTGDIFTCENATLEGGCGFTENCTECGMLKLINDTFKSKKSFINIPITLFTKINQVREELDLRISTERVENLVLLRIDQIDRRSI